MSGDGMPELAAVLEHARANRPGAALVAAVAAWRELRAPAIAELVERIAAPIDARLPALDGPKQEVHKAWLDLAARRRPADLGRLLARLGDAAIPQLRERFELLAGFAPDPRLFAAALAIPQRYHSYEAGPLLTVAFDLAAGSADPRAPPVLDALLGAYLQPEHGDSKAWREHLAKHARRATKVRDRLPTSVAVPPAVAAQIAACRAACETLALVDEAAAYAEPAPAGGALDELLAAVFAHPDDDQARAVYADALQDRGDPRGEFIALQLQRERDGKLPSAAEKRERELLKQHARDWIAPLDAAIRPDSIRFARGFLDAARVEFKTPAQRAELPAHPLWATVRELDCVDQSFVTRASLVSLRRATVTAKSLGELAAREQPVPLEAVIGTLEMNYGLRMRYGMLAVPRSEWGGAPEVGALVHLRSLQLHAFGGEGQCELTPQGLRWLLDSRLGAQLAELDLYAGRGEIELAPWIAALAARERAPGLRLRFTNGNTASGTTQILVVFDLVKSGARVDVTMTVNHDMVDIRFLSIRRQIEHALAGLPHEAAPSITVRYAGSKKRTALGYPSIASLLQQSFSTVAIE